MYSFLPMLTYICFHFVVFQPFAFVNPVSLCALSLLICSCSEKMHRYDCMTAFCAKGQKQFCFVVKSEVDDKMLYGEYTGYITQRASFKI